MLVAALGCLNPVFAQLSLVLAIRVSHLHHHHVGAPIVPIGVHWYKDWRLQGAYVAWRWVESPSHAGDSVLWEHLRLERA